jgi:uncharacterized membrane protein YbhN (UPF0104 family)
VAATSRVEEPRRRFRRRSTRVWIVARVLLVASLVPLGLAGWLLLRPVDNPGVQRCGSPLAFVVSGTNNARLPRTGDPTFTPETPALAAQPRCTERASERLELVAAWGGLFVLSALAGAALGLVDDRLAFRRAPRFEELLREPPPDTPSSFWDRPVVPVDELGAALPRIEREDIEAVGVWGAAALVVVPLVVGGTSMVEVVEDLRLAPLLIAVVLGMLACATVALSLLAVQGPTGSPRESAAVALAGAFLVPFMPAFGWTGLQAHYLARRGMANPEARRLVGVSALVGVAAVALLALMAVAVMAVDDRVGTWPPRAALLVLVALVGSAVGVALLPVRLRRLVFPLDRTTFAELGRIGRDPLTVVGLAAGSFLRPVVGGLALAASVAAVGGETAALPVIAVAVVALVGGAISPTPGGLVVVECIAVVGLSFLGVEPVSAAAAVVVWRLTMFWLPMIPGAVATRHLRRRSVLA